MSFEKKMKQRGNQNIDEKPQIYMKNHIVLSRYGQRLRFLVVQQF